MTVPQPSPQLIAYMMAEWQTSGMARSLGIHLTAVGAGTATMEAVVDPKFYNPQQRLHGGYTATLIDSALGCAVQSCLQEHVGFGTVELHVNYVRKIDGQTGRLICTAKVLHAGRTMLTAEAKLADSTGKLYAHGSGTFLVYPTQTALKS